MTWTHNMCLGGWRAKEGARQPVTIVLTEPDTCCWCGAENTDGIYKREDPATLKCEHKPEEAGT